MGNSTKQVWEKPTLAQRLSNRTVLRFQEITEEFRDDLNILPLFQNSNHNIERAYFVSCDTNFPPSETSHRRYYNARLLGTFQFAQSNSILWDWLTENVARFEPLFEAAAAAVEGKSRFALFRQAVTSGKSDQAGKERTHDLIIDAVAVVPYFELLPSYFDKIFVPKGSTAPLCCWVELRGKRARSYSFNGFRKRKDELPDDQEISSIDFNANVPATNKDELKMLFGDFVEDFMLGKIPLRNHTKESPYKEKCSISAKLPRKDSEADLRGFVVPVYDFHEPCGPCGGFEGWVMICPKKGFDPDKATTKKDAGLSWTGLKLATRSFARRVREEQMRELIEEEWEEARDAADFTSSHYQHYGGWFLEMKRADIATIRLRESEYFSFCRMNKGKLEPVAADASSDISHIVVNLSDSDELDSGVREKRRTIAFRKRSDTLLPTESENLEKYGVSVAKSVRDVYEAAQLRQTERLQGFADAAEEAYSKTAHQLRKLARGIRKDSSEAELDVLRRYFSLTFLSPKNLRGDATVGFATDIYTGGAFGPKFLSGRTLQAFFISSYRYSAALYPLMEKLHNKTTTLGPKPRRQIVFSKSPIWRATIWSHHPVVRRAATKHRSFEEQDERLLQAKVFSFAALVALWSNTLEHSPNGSQVFLSIEPKTGRVVVKNKAAPAVRSGGSEDRSLGTKQTLDYYFGTCFPRGTINSDVDFPEAPKRHVFTVKIPIPTKTLLCKHC